MSVVVSGAFIVQVVGWGLLGLILLILGTLRTAQGRSRWALDRIDLATWIEGVQRFLTGSPTSSSPRSPPDPGRGDRVPVRVTLSNIRRDERTDRFS